MPDAALPTLRTARLTLRPPELSDADAITEGIGNYDVCKWLSSVPYPYSRDDAVEWLQRNVGTSRQTWMICKDDQVIGNVSNEEEFGFWLSRKVWRRGYAFEAGHAAINHWFSNPAAGNLYAGYFPGNVRSAAALYALGFVDMAVNPHEARARGQTVDAQELRLTRPAWDARQRFELKSMRLVVRMLDDRDAKGVLALAHPTIARNMLSFDPAWSLEDAADFIRNRRWRGRTAGMFAIECDGDFVGVIGFGGSPVTVMYALKPECWGQGIATEALRAFVGEIFSRFPINRITADHHEDNPASGAVLRKAGFVEVGRGMGGSKARAEPAPTREYELLRSQLL